jgi:hypothetical protein
MAQVAVLVDFDSIAQGAKEGGGASDEAALAAACLRYAAGVGRIALARGYADWTKRTPDGARAVQAARVVPVMAVAGPGGESRATTRLCVDALEALYAGGEPDAFVIVSGDASLLPLVQALRADGSDVLFVTPGTALADDIRAEADAVTTLEEVLGGAVGRPSVPRPVVADEEEEAPPPPAERAPRGGGFAREGGGRGPWSRHDEGGYGRSERGGGERGGYAPRERWGAAPSRAPAPLDLEHYDWSGFVKLIDELEHRLPFVGVRYLVNKVLGVRNCGTDDPRQKRDLINRAVDEGILEMYEVGNVEDRRDPVTACRLDRRNSVVVSVLGADTTTPAVPEAREAPARGEPEGDEREPEAAPAEVLDDDAD